MEGQKRKRKKKRKLYLVCATKTWEPADRVMHIFPAVSDCYEMTVTDMISSDYYKKITTEHSEMPRYGSADLDDMHAFRIMASVQSLMSNSSNYNSSSCNNNNRNISKSVTPALFNDWGASYVCDSMSYTGSPNMPSSIFDESGSGGKVSWICKYCNQDCYSKSQLSRHLKTHSVKDENRRFVCALCGSEYTYKYNLKRHLKKTHKLVDDMLRKYLDYETPEASKEGENLVASEGKENSKGLRIEGGSLQVDQTVNSNASVQNGDYRNGNSINGNSLNYSNGNYNNDSNSVNRDYAINGNGVNGNYHINNGNDNNGNFNLTKDHYTNGDDSLHGNDNSRNYYNSLFNYDHYNNSFNYNQYNYYNYFNRYNNINTSSPAPLNSHSNTSSRKKSEGKVRNAAPKESVPAIFACDVCGSGKTFSTKWSLRRHMQNVHKVADDTDDGSTQMELPNAESAKASDTGKSKSNVCPICQEQFDCVYIVDGDMRKNSSFALRAHLKEVHQIGAVGTGSADV